MQYPGPTADDLANVKALNRAFLDTLRNNARHSAVLDDVVPPLKSLCRALSDIHVDRLAAAPFLLFSVRERDADYWDALFDAQRDNRNGDLFEFPRTNDSDDGRLIDAALGFLWTLAVRNTYAARIVSGASLSWCERLADCTLMSLLTIAGRREDLLIPRFADREDIWSKLLGAGVSSERDVRRAAQLTVLQTMLTRDAVPGHERLSAAACRMPAPRTR